MLSMLLSIDLDEINIPAQIIMLCAFLVMACSFWCKNRKRILQLQILSSILFVLQYVLLDEATTGAILNFVSIGRAYFFGKKKTDVKGRSKFDKHMKKNSILYTFTIVFIFVSIMTWQGPKSILALMATLVYTFGMWADKPQYIRMSSNIAAFFWFSYNFIVGGYVGCITETIMFISNSIAIYKNCNKDNTIKECA